MEARLARATEARNALGESRARRMEAAHEVENFRPAEMLKLSRRRSNRRTQPSRRVSAPPERGQRPPEAYDGNIRPLTTRNSARPSRGPEAAVSKFAQRQAERQKQKEEAIAQRREQRRERPQRQTPQLTEGEARIMQQHWGQVSAPPSQCLPVLCPFCSENALP